MLNKKILLPFIILLIFTLAACTTNNIEKNPIPDSPVVEEHIPDNNTDENLVQEGNETKIMPIAAFDLYMDKYPTTKVRKIELDSDRGIYAYKVKGYENGIEYELKLDPTNGDILKEESEKENDLEKDGEITRTNVEKIEEFVNKVLQEAGEGSILDEWTLKAKNGRPIVEIEVDLPNGKDLEHTYDIETGELIEAD